jgi:hypothetical protein
MSKENHSNGVTIGNVTGGIYGSIIAGRDVRDSTITLGGQSIPADKDPTMEEFKQLLAEIQKNLADITAQKEVLEKVSTAAPHTAAAAEATVRDAAKKATAKKDLKPEDAKSVQEGLIEATSILSTILDSTKTLAKKTIAAGRAAKPLIEKLEPLVEKVAVAALWVAKLWP